MNLTHEPSLEPLQERAEPTADVPPTRSIGKAPRCSVPDAGRQTASARNPNLKLLDTTVRLEPRCGYLGSSLTIIYEASNVDSLEPHNLELRG